MASITKQRMGKYTYLNVSVSFWDPEKKRPDNEKVRIGKIDLHSGEPVYKQEYLDKLVAAGESIEGMRVWDKSKEAMGAIGGGSGCASATETAEAILDSVKDFGVVYFLRSVAEKTGMLGILRDALPDAWKEVFALACYLIAEDKPVMYCEEWAASNYGLDAGSMSSQRVSDLLASFGYQERNSFYKSWHEHIRGREYIALDITSVSSYSGQIEACERGYNRDGDDLPQVNICMLFGEDSKLPVYQTVYSGSLNDVTTLRSTIAEFAALVGKVDIMVVMDKGFFSLDNIKLLLNGEGGKQRYRFLIGVPFTNDFAKGLVESERADIDSIENVVLTNSSPIRGKHKRGDWGCGVELSAHVFCNPEKAVKERNELFGYVTSLSREAYANPQNDRLWNEYCHYLNIDWPHNRPDETLKVGIREEVVTKELATTGWFVLLSNHIEDPQVAHDIYRNKDVVEKSFSRYKNNLGLDRLRVHGDDRMQNKIFVAFIALIIASSINGTMKEQGLFKRMTFDKLILALAKLKSATVGVKTILRPVTKVQSDILKAFDIKPPDYDTLEPPVPKRRGRKPKPKSE